MADVPIRKARAESQALPIIFFLGLASLLVLAVLCLAPANSDGMYDYTVRIETEEMLNMFEYKGAKLKPVDKVRVTYFPGDDAEKRKPYQVMWFHQGKPLGVQRHSNFDLQPGSGILIRVSHKNVNPTYGEQQAAANAILRVFLDVYMESLIIVEVAVPSGSYHIIASELRNHNFSDQQKPGGVLSIFLTTDSGNTSQTLYYTK